MSRKTVPILLSSIAALFIALVVIIVLMLVNDQVVRISSLQRRDAISTLLSGTPPEDPAEKKANLAGIADYVSSPLKTGGSLSNLLHYLSKDPGRSEFFGVADRRRAEVYLDGSSIYTLSGDLPSWVAGYLGGVEWLFEAVKTDLFEITGYPGDLTDLEFSGVSGDSAEKRTAEAMQRFASIWIPSGKTIDNYKTDRKEVRAWLLDNRKFNKRLSEIDGSWKSLTAALYNLSVNPNWRIAASYAPEFEEELDQLIVMVLAADIHYRSRDLLYLVEDADREPGETKSPGIIWSPEFFNYKNIPEITGYTADTDPTIFFAKVSVSYTYRDSRTQTWLNRRKDWLSDYFQRFFSMTERNDFSPIDQSNPDANDWAAAGLKARAVHGINRKIILATPFGKKKVNGVRDVSFVRVNLMANP